MSNNNIKSVIRAKDTDIAVISAVGKEDYISLTDIARYRSDEPKDVVKTGYVQNLQLNFWDFGSE